jgi:uncharacterized integral membrane protein (TIGR00697 family)
VISNILSTKITYLPLIHLSMDGGTLIYPLTFTLRDFVHKTCGKKNSRIVVVTAGAISFITMALLWIVGKMPSDPSWNYQNDYENILMPVLRITLASIIAQIISELVDTEIFSYVYKKFSDLAGSLISNIFALIADSIIFCGIAFFGVFPMGTVIKIFISNIILKFVLSSMSAPTIRLIPRTIDKNQI